MKLKLRVFFWPCILFINDTFSSENSAAVFCLISYQAASHPLDVHVEDDGCDKAADRTQKYSINNWRKPDSKSNETGASWALDVTQVYQQNLVGGVSTESSTGRYTGRYDLELSLDLNQSFNLSGSELYGLIRGGLSDGIDEAAIASLFGVNGLAVGDNAAIVWQLYLQQSLLDDQGLIRVGILDPTVEFDVNRFANDEVSQFLNGSLINNSSIPFPDNGLGLFFYLEPEFGSWAKWSLSSAILKSDDTNARFNGSLAGAQGVLSLAETGFKTDITSNNGSLDGSYRIGAWYHSATEPGDNPNFIRDSNGYYLSVDQLLFKEKGSKESGLGVFARYGSASRRDNEIYLFWSLGMQYQGLFATRNEDVTGFGISKARVRLADDDSLGHSINNSINNSVSNSVHNSVINSGSETTLELYYNIQTTSWLNLSPSIQYVINPGGTDDINNALVAAVRVQVSF